MSDPILGPLMMINYLMAHKKEKKQQALAEKQMGEAQSRADVSAISSAAQKEEAARLASIGARFGGKGSSPMGRRGLSV